MNRLFRVGLTHDFLKPDSTVGIGDTALKLLNSDPDLEWEVIPEKTAELRPDQISQYDAILVLGAAVTSTTLRGSNRLTLIARFGVGYDKIDVNACTAHGVMLTITPDGVRRPVATSILAFLLALAHKMLIKDKITREGRWNERMNYNGTGLVGRVLGSIGIGNIGAEMFRLAKPLGMRHIACDPYTNPDLAREIGVELVDLDTLLKNADFIAINCPLNQETYHLINAERLALMKPTAYLINTARGPIVDQDALTKVLSEGRLQGAALDVFDREPVDIDDPILQLDNVIVAPHSLAWTDQMFDGNGRSAAENILEVAAGRIPQHVVNRDVLNSALLQAKLQRNRE